MNRAELKKISKEQIKGKIGTLFIITLLIAIIAGGIATLVAFIPIPFIGPLVDLIVIVPAFSLSVIRVYLNLANDGTPLVRDTFSGFDDFWSAFKLSFLVGLFTFLWSLLFVIPGIVKSFAYSQAFYILAENKGKPALECIRESVKMTNGHKMDLFILGLSFFWWNILGSITFGLAYIWIMPYMATTFANAYKSLKPQTQVDSAQAIEA